MVARSFTKLFTKSSRRSQYLASQMPSNAFFVWSTSYKEGVAHRGAFLTAFSLARERRITDPVRSRSGLLSGDNVGIDLRLLVRTLGDREGLAALRSCIDADGRLFEIDLIDSAFGFNRTWLNPAAWLLRVNASGV